MKKVVLFALVAALAAGALLYIYLGKLEQQSEVKVVYEDVLVAAADIPAYSAITEEMVTVKQVPQGTSHPIAARTPAEAVGFVTENLIVEGEEILPVKLKQPGQAESGLSYVVPEGMRAVTVAVDEVSGVAGFLQRGDYVDVISYTSTSYEMPTADQVQTGTTETTDPAQNAVSQSTTVIAAQNILVAAIGRSLSSSTSSTEDQSAIGYNSVTLILSPEDAMRVIQGSRSGSLILILRASGDHDTNTEDPVINDSLLIKAK